MRIFGISIMLLCVLSYSFSLHGHEFNSHFVSDSQELVIYDSSQPLDASSGDSFIKAAPLIPGVIIFLIASLISVHIPIFKRLQYLTPVFYQSNYVIHHL